MAFLKLDTNLLASSVRLKATIWLIIDGSSSLIGNWQTCVLARPLTQSFTSSVIKDGLVVFLQKKYLDDKTSFQGWFKWHFLLLCRCQKESQGINYIVFLCDKYGENTK